MDNIQSKVQPSFTSNNIFSNKNLIIFLLVLIILVPLLGFFFNFTYFSILELLGYVTGDAIEKSSNALSDTAKFGIDILNGTVHDVSDIVNQTSDSISDASKFVVDIANGTVNDVGSLMTGDNNTTQNENFEKYLKEPEPDNSYSIIQTPISSNNMNWCLVGEMAGRRSCVSVNEQTKCISGQVFPNQYACTKV